MHPHPYWNLFLHSNAELERILGEPITERTELHSWPLSAVEALTTASGRRLVYKVQHAPSVEVDFLQRARSSLLLAIDILQRDEQQAAVLMPFLTAPTLRDLALDESALIERGRSLLRSISAMDGDLPIYFDLGTIPTWREFAHLTLDMLAALVHSGDFAIIQPDDLDFLSAWTRSEAVLSAIECTSQLINGDLKSEHIFCAPDGERIIDWQRPYRAPGEIDLVMLLESQQAPAHRYVSAAGFGLRWFLHLHWAVEARTHLLPSLPFFDQWSRRAIDHIRSGY